MYVGYQQATNLPSFDLEDLFLVPEAKWYFELYTTHDIGKQRILVKDQYLTLNTE